MRKKLPYVYNWHHSMIYRSASIFASKLAPDFLNGEGLTINEVKTLTQNDHPPQTFPYTGSLILLCDFWFALKWHSNALYIWIQDIFIITKAHHLIWNISWCQLTLFLPSKLTWSKQAIFHYFSNYFYLKLSFFWN